MKDRINITNSGERSQITDETAIIYGLIIRSSIERIPEVYEALNAIPGMHLLIQPFTRVSEKKNIGRSSPNHPTLNSNKVTYSTYTVVLEFPISMRKQVLQKFQFNTDCETEVFHDVPFSGLIDWVVIRGGD